MKTVITFGTFDLFHIGHLHILQGASKMGDHLVVGVSSDALNFCKKQRHSVYSQQERMAIVGHIKGVDEVFLEESLELKGEYIRRFAADILVMGDDWHGRFDHYQSQCRICYLPRTPSISTTSIIEIARSSLLTL